MTISLPIWVIQVGISFTICLIASVLVYRNSKRNRFVDPTFDAALVFVVCGLVITIPNVMIDAGIQDHYNEIESKKNIITQLESLPVEWKDLVTTVRNDSSNKWHEQIVDKFLSRSDISLITLEQANFLVNYMNWGFAKDKIFPHIASQPTGTATLTAE